MAAQDRQARAEGDADKPSGAARCLDAGHVWPAVDIARAGGATAEAAAAVPADEAPVDVCGADAFGVGGDGALRRCSRIAAIAARRTDVLRRRRGRGTGGGRRRGTGGGRRGGTGRGGGRGGAFT